MIMPKKLEEEGNKLAEEYFADDSYGEDKTLWDYIYEHGSKELIEFIELREAEREEYLARGIIIN